MHLPHPLLFVGLTLVCLSTVFTAQDVLLVGNSFTFRPRTNIGPVTQVNGAPNGAVPGLFQLLAVADGKIPQVHEETVGGKDLAFHSTTKSSH